jgi:hypothetical protein
LKGRPGWSCRQGGGSNPDYRPRTRLGASNGTKP